MIEEKEDDGLCQQLGHQIGLSVQEIVKRLGLSLYIDWSVMDVCKICNYASWYYLHLRSHCAVISLRVNLSRYIQPGYRCTSTHFHFRFANHLAIFPCSPSLAFSLVLDPSSSLCESSLPQIHVISAAPRLSLPSRPIPGPLAALFLIAQRRMTVDCTDPPSHSHTIPPLLSLQNPTSSTTHNSPLIKSHHRRRPPCKTLPESPFSPARSLFRIRYSQRM